MTREEAKAYIIRHCNPDYPKGKTEWEQVMNMAIKALEQPEPQWIPVAERLPENKQEVLVTEYGETDIGRRFEGRWVDRYGDKMKDVTAWMLKPEPYKESNGWTTTEEMSGWIKEENK